MKEVKERINKIFGEQTEEWIDNFIKQCVNNELDCYDQIPCDTCIHDKYDCFGQTCPHILTEE